VAAHVICERIRAEMETVPLSSYDLGNVLKALFQTQPFIALDVFLLPGQALRNRRVFDAGVGFGTPVEGMDPAVLRQWAEREPGQRYPQLGSAIAMFKSTHGEEENEAAPLFLEMLSHAPDKRAFLGDFWNRLHPRSWSGSLANILVERKGQLKKLAENPDFEIRGWVTDMLPEVDRWIEHERARESGSEQSFE
jgi:hypothetical protein